MSTNLTKIVTRTLSATILTTAFFSCQKNSLSSSVTTTDSLSSNVKQVGSLYLYKNVLVLNDATLSSLSTTAKGVYLFPTTTTQTDSLTQGMIIVGTTVQNDSIKNIIGKITSVASTSAGLEVHTDSVGWSEMIYKGTITGTYSPKSQAAVSVNNVSTNYINVPELTSDATSKKVEALMMKASTAKMNSLTSSLSSTSLLSGLSKTYTTGYTFNRFSFDYTIPIIDSATTTTSGVSTSVTASMDVSGGFVPTVGYSISFDAGKISNFTADLYLDSLEIKDIATITATIGYGVSFTDLVSVPIAPIALGSTGLIISPAVSAGPYFEISTTGSISALLFDVIGTADFAVNKVTPSVNLDVTNSDPYITSVKGNVTGEVGLQVKGTVGLLYGTVDLASAGIIGRIGLLPGITATLVPTKSVTYDLKGKISADMTLGIGVSPARASFSYPLFSKTTDLYSKTIYF